MFDIKTLIEDNLSYEEIGRRFNVTSTTIKNWAKRQGIKLTPRRKINENETFNRGKNLKPKRLCPYCGRPILNPNSKYCSLKCSQEVSMIKRIDAWKNGLDKGWSGDERTLKKFIKNYIYKIRGGKCELCGCDKINPSTNTSILQVHHIDGNCENNKEENLQLLCPNCHAMTENYGARNKKSKRCAKHK